MKFNSIDDLFVLAENNELIGLFDDIPEDFYHMGPGVSRSTLSLMKRSYNHYLYAKTAPRDEPNEQMKIGTLFHYLVLEPHKVEDLYYVYKKPDRRTKAGKEKWAEIQSISHKILIEQSSWDTANDLATQAKQNKFFQRILKNGKPEQTLYWIDKETGILLKARIDWVTEEGFLIDLKTSRDASISSFGRDVIAHNYDLQAYFYTEGWKEVHGNFPKGFGFCVIENTEPFEMAFYDVPDAVWEVGQEKCTKLLKRMKKSITGEIDKGYPQRFVDLHIPGYGMDIGAQVNDYEGFLDD